MDKVEKNRLRAKEYYWKHRSEILQKRAEYRDGRTDAERQATRTYMKKWYAENREDQVKKKGIYRKKNKDKFRLYRKRWESKNPHSRIARLLRHRIRQALKSQNLKKNESLVKLLGTSVQEARRHIEMQFDGGMAWENLGEWHIDHIIPLASFDLSDEDEKRKAFHFTNLQPLWAKTNLSKGKRPS